MGLGQMWCFLVVNPSQNKKKLEHLAQTQVLGPRTMGLGQMLYFLVVSEGSTPKVTTFGPNPSSRPVFEASPNSTEGFGYDFLGQHHQHKWAFVSDFWHLNLPRASEGS